MKVSIEIDTGNYRPGSWIDAMYWANEVIKALEAEIESWKKYRAHHEKKQDEYQKILEMREA